MWGVWIEIHYRPLYYEFSWVAPPHGERGLKYPNIRIYDKLRLSRSPHGERGLKSVTWYLATNTGQSLPMRGAWIEIVFRRLQDIGVNVAPHAGSVG